MVLQQSPENIDEKYRNSSCITDDDGFKLNAVTFDAMWTVAVVLNYTEEMRPQNNMSKTAAGFEACAHLEGELVLLNEFNYSNAFMGCVMKNNYYKVNFSGASISFTMLTVTL